MKQVIENLLKHKIQARKQLNHEYDNQPLSNLSIEGFSYQMDKIETEIELLENLLKNITASLGDFHIVGDVVSLQFNRYDLTELIHGLSGVESEWVNTMKPKFEECLTLITSVSV